MRRCPRRRWRGGDAGDHHRGAVAAQVRGDHPPSGGERGDLGGPHRVVEGVAVDQDERERRGIGGAPFVLVREEGCHGHDPRSGQLPGAIRSLPSVQSERAPRHVRSETRGNVHVVDDYRRIADRLADDIAAGRLRPGERLPPQRAFARRRGIAGSTAGRVYAELVRRGLVVGEVGRGTFVRAAPCPRDAPSPSRPPTPRPRSSIWSSTTLPYRVSRSCSPPPSPRCCAPTSSPSPCARLPPPVPPPPARPPPPSSPPRAGARPRPGWPSRATPARPSPPRSPPSSGRAAASASRC